MQKGASFGLHTPLWNMHSYFLIVMWSMFIDEEWVTRRLSSPWYWVAGLEFKPNALAQVLDLHLQSMRPLWYLHTEMLSSRKSYCLWSIPIHHYLPIKTPEFGGCSVMSGCMNSSRAFRCPSVISSLACCMVPTERSRGGVRNEGTPQPPRPQFINRWCFIEL